MKANKGNEGCPNTGQRETKTRTGRGSRRHRIEESARGVMTLYTCMQGRRFLSGLLAAAAAAAPASAVVRFRGCGGVCGCPLSRVRLRLRLSAFAGAAAQARLRIPSCSDNNAGPKPFCPKLVSESQYPIPVSNVDECQLVAIKQKGSHQNKTTTAKHIDDDGNGNDDDDTH